MSSIRDGRPFTIDNLMLSLRLKAHASGYVLPTLNVHESAAFIGDAINAYGLTEVIAGRHDGKPVTFAKAMEIVFGGKQK